MFGENKCTDQLRDYREVGLRLCFRIVDFLILENKPCWATSHDPCEKQQVVDLVQAGFKPEELDEKKPPITVREW